MPKKELFHQTANALIKEYGRLLGPKGIAVYAVLNSYADKKRSCYPSVGLISSLIGISERQVSRELKKLESLNILSVRRYKGHHNSYQLISRKGWVSLTPRKFVVSDGGPEPWPEDVPTVDFGTPITCEWDHDWGVDGNDNQCHWCGLLKAEEEYKQIGGYKLTPEEAVIIEKINGPFLESLYA